MEPKWLDAPFFNLLEDFASLQTYFMAQALFIAKIVVTLNIGFMAIKYAIKGEGFKEPVVKLITSLLLFLIIMNSYPLMIRGLNSIIYKWSYGSTYGKVAEMIQKTTTSGEATEFWAKKANDPDAYSDIIKVLVEKTGNGNIAKKYVLDIFDKGSDNRPGMFIRPNAVIRLLMLTFENIWNKVLICLKPATSATLDILPRDPGGAVILGITAFAVLIGGIFASIQYFIGAIEFTLLTSVGCILLPFMLWDGTKFLTEKLVGAIVGQALKLLFITLAFMLTINGFLALMIREFDGHIDQAIYTIFTIFFYWMLCQHGPALATALLTGTPQLSMAEGLQTAGSMAGAALLGAKGAKAVASGAAKTGVQAKSAINKSQGAAKAAGELGNSKVGAVMGSLAGSAKDSIKSGMHGLAQSLTRGKGSLGSGRNGGGASGSAPTNGLNNRFSTLERRNATNENGNRKTGKEFGAESKQMGYDRYKNIQQAKIETANQKAAEEWKDRIRNKPKPVEEPKRYDGGTPLGQSIPQRNTGEDK